MMSPHGASRHSRRCKGLVAVGCTANKQGQLALPGSAAFDPNETLRCGRAA
jgi:hypothetical protein